ncbi:MAG: CinA family protein [Rhodospirillales bacterium]|nr:CinA family protein [Rhodospirillales bacterium]USO07739.1 MAG: CinA family protein [Rhodospirillales bacterium]
MDVLVLEIFERLKQRGWMIAVAESCTAGLVAARIADVPGASDFLDRGFVTYSNQAKMEMLEVPPVLIETRGAVSAEVAEAMAGGALRASRAKIAVSVTGIAGPGGGSDEKPVGLVHIGVATWDGAQGFVYRFDGDRAAIRRQSVEAALECVRAVLA